MSFFTFNKKNHAVPDSKETTSDEMKLVTENLYKQNHELAVKNKTLSLLSKLYSISILALEPKELAERVAEVIKTDFSFELVAISLFDAEKDELQPLGFAESRRFHSSQSGSKSLFDTIAIPKIASRNLLKKVVEGKGMESTEDLSDIWGGLFPAEDFLKIKEAGHVRSSVVYPLIIEERTLGVLIISLNRVYADLVEYEKESIRSFINVIAVALDKALLYKQLKITNANLETANNRLKELDKQKSEFVSFATHQLRAPLTAMKGYASLILEGDLGEISDALKDAVSRIFESSKTLTNIVDDYLNVSRIELGTMKYTLDKLDLNELVKSVIGELRPNIDSKKEVAFTFSATPGDYVVNADRDKFKQVLANVIDNSLKYTPKGFVNVTLERTGSNIRFMVKDNGVGIAPEVMPKLFNKFSRANNANTVNIHGTGLGLFVAKDVVLAHHGKIWAESEGEGKGSAFIVELAAA